jgi:hypothetical protein
VAEEIIHTLLFVIYNYSAAFAAVEPSRRRDGGVAGHSPQRGERKTARREGACGASIRPEGGLERGGDFPLLILFERVLKQALLFFI